MLRFIVALLALATVVQPLVCTSPPPSKTALLKTLLLEDLSQLTQTLEGAGRAKLVMEHLIQGVDPSSSLSLLTPIEMKNSHIGNTKISKKLHDKLSTMYSPISSVASVSNTIISADRTAKFLIDLASDHNAVETVLIPFDNRRSSTLCVSSQIGCKQGCKFCATGKMGLVRNLSTEEIMAQVFLALQFVRERNEFVIDNIVFMGMGEPTDNLQSVLAAAELMSSVYKLARNKIIISTIAPTRGILALLGRSPVAVAWSVHAVDDDLRKRLVPTTTERMVDLRDAFIDTFNFHRVSKAKRVLMIEYVLIDGVNDGEDHAEALAQFVQKFKENCIKIIVNAIPFNDIGGGGNIGFQKPSEERIAKFQKVLMDNKVVCYVRAVRGDDESSACGQLATQRKDI